VVERIGNRVPLLGKPVMAGDRILRTVQWRELIGRRRDRVSPPRGRDGAFNSSIA
jgi:hypothetical protein